MTPETHALLVDPRFWALLFIFGVPGCAIEIVVAKFASRLADIAIERLLGITLKDSRN